MTNSTIAALTISGVDLSKFTGYAGDEFMDEVTRIADAITEAQSSARPRDDAGRYVYDIVVDGDGIIDGMLLGVTTHEGGQYVLSRGQSDLTVDRAATGVAAASAIYTALIRDFEQAARTAEQSALTGPCPRTQPATMREALANLDERGEYTSLIDVSLSDLLEVGESDAEFDAATSRVDMLAAAQVHEVSAWCLSYEVKAVRGGRAYVLVSNGIREYVESEGLVDLDDPQSVEDYLADIENND